MEKIGSILSHSYVRVDANEPFSQLIGRLVESGQTEALVFNGETYAGMFAHYLLPKPRTNSNEMKVKSVTAPAPVLQTDDDISTAAQRMFESGKTVLPVLKNDALVGVITIGAVLKHLRSSERADVHVSDVRHPQSITLLHTDPIGKALDYMHNRHIHHFPVVDEKNTMTGFLSLHDVLAKFYLQSQKRDRGQQPKQASRAFKAESPDLLALPVANFMNTRDAITIRESDTVGAAIDAMLREGVHSLVILENGKPAAITTTKDILEALLVSTEPPAPTIQYKGLRELDIDEYTLATVKRISSYYAEKLGFYAHNEFQLTIHCKQRSNNGRRHRYTVHARLTSPGAHAVATEAREWDLRTALHEALQELELAVQHHFKEGAIPSVKKLAAMEGDDNLPGGVSS
jgi:CBS domain-containing protein